jgi:hypothetical protein
MATINRSGRTKFLLKSLYPYSPPNNSSNNTSMNDSLLNPARGSPPSIFEAVISNPYAGFTRRHSLNNNMEASSEIVAPSSLAALRGPPPAAKRSAGERTSLASYIRLFEPMVIKALKHYTVSCQVRHNPSMVGIVFEGTLVVMFFIRCYQCSGSVSLWASRIRYPLHCLLAH